MGFIEIALIVGAALGRVVEVFFKNLVTWFKNDVYPELKKLFGEAVKGIKAFINKAAPVVGKIVQKIESYIYQAGSWLKRTVSKVISASEVPDNLKERVDKTDEQNDVDITSELEMELS